MSLLHVREPREAPPVRSSAADWRPEGRIDWVLALAALALCAAGVVAVYAATRAELMAAGRSPHYYLNRDMLNVAIGAALAAAAALVDYRSLVAYAPVVWAVAVVGLLGVLTPIGSVVNGAHAWFSLGAVQLEPSEFAKLAALLLGGFLLGGATPPDRRGVLLTVGGTGVLALLVLAEPALGVALVLVAILMALLASSGAPGRWVGGLLLTLVTVSFLAVAFHLIKPYQEQRFTAFTNPQAAGTANYQVHQSEIAIGSGGLLGHGFLNGDQTNGGYIPEQQTDFVFSVIGEEGGFAASSALLVGYAVLLWRGLRIASRAGDRLGRMLAGTVVIWFALQTFINIGMTMGIAPVTGIPLPFVSYGGSAMFTDLAAVGLLLGVGRVSTP